MKKINLGSGRILIAGYTNIDKIQIIDNNGKKIVDIVMDIEKDKLPFKDNEVQSIRAENLLEHVDNLQFVLNECHRVLSKEGILSGCVPVAGTDIDFRDPTHKRHFVADTFGYFCGQALWSNDKKPKHPKYADYGFLSWNMLQLKRENDLIYFKLSPNK